MCVSFWDYSFYFMKVGNLREGEALGVSEARFSPSRSPFPGTQLLYVVGMCLCTGGAMDSTVLVM